MRNGTETDIDPATFDGKEAAAGAEVRDDDRRAFRLAGRRSGKQRTRSAS